MLVVFYFSSNFMLFNRIYDIDLLQRGLNDGPNVGDDLNITSLESTVRTNVAPT